eukprot:CAMPEP_0182421332 /NCGR_PEP_ID=MMETSP1167-20130531/6670_1 /TAXON_ID=2988 /ORGANISM="Mallomonas Sp, Strain CCMP3275" /LENGTH=98 /DNA_ID=CAMNT_0024598355 /DNA_START=530 /DNA_END=823 /DNA_ORIENTATION=+
MAKMGIKGQQKSAAVVKNLTTAEAIFEKIMALELQFAEQPSFSAVQEVMELLRDAAERFSEAEDARFQSAILKTQRFLQREDVVRILDSNCRRLPRVG